MKNLKLHFAQRIQLTNLLSVVTGPLAKMALLQHVWRAVRFSESENAELKLTANSDGTTTVVAPSPDWGSLTVEFEDAEASALQQELDGHQGFRVSDVDWVDDVKRQLAGKEK